MFEGLVHRVLVGYLGRYVKNIHKDQLKLSLWNEEVLLENVELIPEAFDYLRLPFAIKQGRVGRLSIRISWKKLGWDHPIIIVLEDVFVSVSPRDDHEWSMEAVEKREYASKKAKLAAAELAKLSRRVCDNQAGKSFISYITAKVLDSIQMSIQNFHVQYNELQPDLVSFGLKFSGLTIKQNLVGSSGGKLVAGQVNKTVVIEGLGIYSMISKGAIETTSLNDAAHSSICSSERSEGIILDHLLHPFDVTISLVVNRAGKPDNDMAQYSIRAEITGLEMSLDEVQLQQILILSDYISISYLREKYGQYRPWGHSLSRKQNGWQILWWHYAQESVLSDVRRKLKKTSWRYLGQRLNSRRKYINLYKIKLEFLQQEQSIDKFILQELEEMEKESYIDDILSYRSAAERELQEVSPNSSSSNMGVNGVDISLEKSSNDEHLSGRSKGWLNWLSRGMLGAGGTDDSSQFSGVVSDEVVKDIYEATEFHPSALSCGDADATDKMFTCAIKLSIYQITAALQSKYSGQKIADLDFKNTIIECKLWGELAALTLLVKSGKMVYPCNERVILQIGRPLAEKKLQEGELTSCKIQVDLLQKRELELSVKAMLQPLEVTYDVEFFLKLIGFFTVLKSFEFQQERVLWSLNGLKDVKTRLLSKAEYALSSQTKLSWDLSILNFVINVPGRDALSGKYNLVLELGSILYTSRYDVESIVDRIQEQSCILKQFSSSTFATNFLTDIQIQDLYSYFAVELENLELKLEIPQDAKTLTILEKFCASIIFASCIISDESILKQLEVYVSVPSIAINFSLPIYKSILALVKHLDSVNSTARSLILKNLYSHNVMLNHPRTSAVGYSITANLKSMSFHVDFGKDGESSSSKLNLFLHESHIRYCQTEFHECLVCTKALKIVSSSSKGENDGCILFSSENQELGFGNSNQDGTCSDESFFTKGSFQLHYKGHRTADFVFHDYKIRLNDVDLHCYPCIVGRLIAFYETLSSYSASSTCNKSFSHVMDVKGPKRRLGFQFQRFGYSNFYESGSSASASISLDCYPFITISNSGYLGSLESSLHHYIPDWRKSFKLRDDKIRNPKFSLKKESKPVHPSLVMNASVVDSFPSPGSLCNTEVFNVDINLSGVRIHFHDCSCIVGTVTIPNSKSALLIYENCMDLLCSVEGLFLTSPWWTKNFKDFLWGPSLSNPSSILNLRVRKGHGGLPTSQLELSIGIQHVYCFLPPEYLAIIIGYFLSSDWSSNLNVQPVSGYHDCMVTKKHNSVVYKFEILDSTLILPVERDDHQFIKIELKQLYCSFILNCSPEIALKDIPYECMVPGDKVANANDCLNIYGRDLVLAILLCKEDDYGCLMLTEGTGCDNFTLIASLDADVWVTLPCESEPCLYSASASTCIMSRIANCQLIADDCYTLHGFEALVDVINQFSSVGNESKCYTSDVLQFFQLKRSLKESGGVPTVALATLFTELRCCANSVSIILCQSGVDSIILKQIAKADMQLIFSASLINETFMDLDLSFSSLALHSLLNSVMIAHCASSHADSSALNICFSKSIEGENNFHISLPSLNIWLHVLDWYVVIDIFNTYSKRMAATVVMESSTRNLSKDTPDDIENAAHTTFQSSHSEKNSSIDHAKEHTDEDSYALSVRSESLGLTVHFPISDAQAADNELKSKVEKHGPQFIASHATEGRKYKFLAVTAQSRSIEFIMVGRKMKLKSILETTSGTVGSCEDKSIMTWPLFQISQVSVMAEFCNNHTDIVDVKLEVQVDGLDVCLSHKVFCFWYGVLLEIPESAPSQSSFGSMNFKIHLRKVSLLISDERWSCGGPLLEIITRNTLLCFIITSDGVESSVASDLEVNYNNIHKVLWEPFVEPWKFQINMVRRQERSALLNHSITTDIHLSSTSPLNLNCTESLIECVFRTIEMASDAWHLTATDPSEIGRFSSSQYTGTIAGGKYAPYILQNLTSLPLVYHVFHGLADLDEFNASETEEGKAVEPGASVPIYLTETPQEELMQFRSAQSSDRLSDRQSLGGVHHFLSIQLEGMSLPSAPISMDLVGVTHFEVDFSKASNKIEVEKKRDISKYNLNNKENVRSDTNTGFTVPVVFDVSVQRYSKLLRLYSTVILSNATSMALELRFDIPFGLSPKILDPIYPGQEVPLPLHLAESGRLRWRPLGNSFLWSEVHDLSNILSQEIKIGFLRSFVCYPTHPSSDPFRCCISVQNFNVPLSGKSKKDLSPCASITQRQSVEISTHDCKQSKKRFIHQVTLSTPLVLNNFLPDAVSLTIESGGVIRTALLSEVETSFHHVEPSHDLGLEFCVQGFKPSSFKFPRTETFSTMAKFNGTKYSLMETMILDPELSNGPLCVTVEKTMDAFSGAREIFICVPFLLYNCTVLPLSISESAAETNRNRYTIPSCYLIEHELLQDKNDGLSLLSSDQDSFAISRQFDELGNSSVENHIVFSRKNASPHMVRSIHKPGVLAGSSGSFQRKPVKHDSIGERVISFIPSTNGSTSRDSDLVDAEHGKVKASMYSPCAMSSVGEFMVRVGRCPPEHVAEREPNSSWSEPFLLVPPSGSSTVNVPQSSPNAAFIISITSSALGGPFAGRTQIITFQPRYVISNACSRDLCYKQKGTELYVHLPVGHHSHLHWTNTLRDLLVSIRFNEPGWQWSGSFLPDHLGDTQVKMRNYITGSLYMIRVEVQNADVSIRDEKIVGSIHGNSGTNLILLSDDDTGFMPYRIDNFSKERLRIYQQRCDTFDTIVHPYTSCPYAWDEPCYPHRLAVEVPGERIVGLFALDDLREYVPVHLKSTSEKPERTLLLSTRADGATKVLSIVDSGYHMLNDLRDPAPSWFQIKSQYQRKPENLADYKEKFTLAISCIGISLINAYPKELLFACAKDITLTLLQSLDQQKLSFQISSLQIDNQLRTTTYPVILSFNPEYRSNVASQRAKDEIGDLKSERKLQISCGSCCEPVVDLAIATWRKKDISLVSFECISLRVGNFRLELEQELILTLLDFFRSVSSRYQSTGMPNSNPSCDPLIYKAGSTNSQSYECVKTSENQLFGSNVLSFSKSQISMSLPSVVPIGAPWQQIHFLARKQKRIYVELFDLAPMKFTLSFSSAPWMVRNGFLTSGESVIHRGLMALADVEGARIHLKQLTISHQMASWESMQDILIRHYTRQLLHEMYKVFGSAGVIGNPMGFVRSLGLGIRDFLAVPARSILQSPTGIITGMAQGTASLLSNTVYALSDTATQFSKAAHKGIVAFTLDDQSRMEKQQKGVASHSKGLINEVLEGLTGLLQSPIKGAEKHGLPGVLSGIALGVTGLVARPAASILEVTGKTAQSIRNRSKLYQIGSHRYRVRLPRLLNRELPLGPYSLEEAVGTSVLMEVDDGLKLKDEVLVICKSLKQAGKFVILTERLIMIVSCPSLVDLGKPEFQGIPVDPEWSLESEIGLDSVIHADTVEEVLHIVGSSSDALLRHNLLQSKRTTRMKHWSSPSTRLPLFQTNLELKSSKDAEDLLHILLSIIEQGKERGWGSAYLLHKSNMRKEDNPYLLLGGNQL